MLLSNHNTSLFDKYFFRILYVMSTTDLQKKLILQLNFKKWS